MVSQQGNGLREQSVGLLELTHWGFLMSENTFRYRNTIDSAVAGVAETLFDLESTIFRLPDTTGDQLLDQKIEKGTLWELFCSQEESLSRKKAGSKRMRSDYFEQAGFELEEDHRREIGLGRMAIKLKYSRKPRELRMWWSDKTDE